MSLTVLDLREARKAVTSDKWRVASEEGNSRQSRITRHSSLLTANEAVSPLTLWGQDPEGYRPIGPYRGVGPMISPRDLSPTMHARMQQVAYYLYLTNPLAHRIVEYLKNYVVGDGVTVKADDPAAAQVIERFWQDPVN